MEEKTENRRKPKKALRWLGLLGIFCARVAFVLALIAGLFVSYSANEQKYRHRGESSIDKNPVSTKFFGDKTLTLISSNRPNGYLVKIFQSKNLTLLNLSRGDSINQYIEIPEIPLSISIGDGICDLLDDSVGTYIREIYIPVEKELGEGIFFMDVNFDGEKELVVEYGGYNRKYYVCYDIVNGCPRPCLLPPLKEPPFNNIVSGYESYTEFDYRKKTIHSFEKIGCCSSVEIWCEAVKDYYFDEPKVQIVRKEEVELATDGHEIERKVYKRIDGELKEISSTCEKQ